MATQMVVGIIILVAIFGVIGIAFTLWKRIPQNTAAVVTGLKKRVISGGGGFVIPIFERYDKISLENIKIIVNIEDAISDQGVPVSVKTVAVVKVKSNTESILTAIEQFHKNTMDKTVAAIQEQAEFVLVGKLREIIAKMTVEELNRDKDKFISNVQENAAVELAGMGLEIKTFTVKDISDKNGYLAALGRKQIAEVKRNADIAEAVARQETTVKVAEADRVGEEAKLIAETKVAEAAKTKELQVQAFRQEEQRAKAAADLAYEIEENKVKKEVTETEMQVELLRRERETEVAAQEAIKRERELDATVRKQAEADKYKHEREAEAAKFQQIAKAEAEASRVKLDGEAEALAVKAKGEAEAAAIRAKGLAEAEAIKAKGLAEAEAMQKKAEAFKQYNDAAVTQMIIEQLPEIAGQIAAPLSQVEKIVAIDGGGNGGGATKVAGYVTDIMAKVPEVVDALTGIDLVNLVANATEPKTQKPSKQPTPETE